MQNGQAEYRRFSATGLALSDNVFTGQHGRQALCLYRSRVAIAECAQIVSQRVADRQVVKVDGLVPGRAATEWWLVLVPESKRQSAGVAGCVHIQLQYRAAGFAFVV